MSNSYEKGRLIENRAKVFLENEGFIMFAYRYKTHFGEIDFVGGKKKALIAFEVKFRKNLDNALFSINKRQCIRIQKTLVCFQQNHPYIAFYYPFLRFDVVLFCKKGRITHIENAWDAYDDCQENAF
ncbi:MAG: YraN family protein [Alphaproteobacteria bacterium]